MSDTLERMAETATAVAKGYVSPRLKLGAERCGAATEFRARRLFLESMAAFRSNLLDCADLSDAFREQLHAFLRTVEGEAPTLNQWDAAMSAKAGKI